MKSIYRAALMVAAFIFLLPLTALAEIREGSFEVTPFIGYNFFETRQNLENRPIFGGRLGYNFTKRFGIEAAGEFIRTYVDDKSKMWTQEGQFTSPIDKVDITFYHLNAVYHLIPDGKFNPFIVAGFGGTNYRPSISTRDMAAFNVGVGAKYWLTENVALRVDLKNYMVGEIFQETYHNIGVTVGLTFAFGGKARPAPAPMALYEPRAAARAAEQTIILAAVPLTITADNKTKTYGAADPVLTASYSGFRDGDDAGKVRGLRLSTATGAAATVGTHIIYASGSNADGYSITEVHGTLTVIPAALTIAADNRSKVYGAADPSLTASYSGFRYGDDAGIVRGLNLSTATGTAATVGTHRIVASGSSADNYSITEFHGALTVTPARLTIAADNKSKAYGAADPVLTASYTGFQYGDDAGIVRGLRLSTATGAAATVGTHSIVASGASADNYSITEVHGALTVTPARLTIAADNRSKTYGAADPVLTAAYRGFQYGEDARVVRGLNLMTATGAAATVGTHIIDASGSSADNYNITEVDGTLTVTPAALTIAADNKTKTYGAADPFLTASYSGFQYGDDAGIVRGLNLSTATGTAATVGTHRIVASGSSAANYNITEIDGTLTVTPAALTIAADNKSKAYGAADPILTASYSGFQYGDDARVVRGLNLSTATGAAATMGTHRIVASGARADNYNITEVDGILTVATAALTIAADNKSKVYGAADPVLTASYSGLRYGDDAGIVRGLRLSTATGTAATVGTHIIYASGSSAAGYSINEVHGTLTVTPAPLTIIADNKSKAYGAADPVLTASYSGFQYGDDARVVRGLNLSTATGAAATVGTHSIVASGASAANYSITEVRGALTVTPAALTITADNKSKIYGAADPVLTASYSGFRYGDDARIVRGLNLSTATGAAAIVGTYSIIASGSSAANYSITEVRGALTVTPAPLTITADNKSKIYGAADPVLTASYSGFRYGDDARIVRGLNLRTATGAAAIVGTHSIIASGSSAANYGITEVRGALTVTPAPLTITADNKSKIHGAADPVLTASYSGFRYGDDAKVVRGLNLSTATGAAATVGTHSIVASGASAANYGITEVRGALTVTPAAKVEEKVIIIAFEDIYFDFDESTLKPEAQKLLMRNVQLLKDNPKAKVRIEGHASASGTHEYNQKLSERRANAVLEYLAKEGAIARDRLSIIGYGKTRPAMNETAPKDIRSKAAKANMRVRSEVIE